MQLENLTKEQFIRDFKDTLHQEQLIKGWFDPQVLHKYMD